jgi:hypothetical protein
MDYLFSRLGRGIFIDAIFIALVMLIKCVHYEWLVLNIE